MPYLVLPVAAETTTVDWSQEISDVSAEVLSSIQMTGSGIIDTFTGVLPWALLVGAVVLVVTLVWRFFKRVAK